MKLFYRETGNGHPLVILHGLFGSSANWHTLSKKFSDQFRVFSPDLRNHGDSPHEEAMDYPTMVHDLVDFFTCHQIHSAFLAGHSMGGKVAMGFALAFPEKVDKLIVVDIAPRYYPVHHDQYLEILNSIDLSKYTSREEIDRILSGKVPNPAIRQFLMKNLKRSENGKFTWRINLRSISRNLEKLGSEIRHENPFPKPTLFIAGNKSDYINREDEPEIKKIFPHSEINYIPGAGHWVHADAPEEFYHQVYQFLSRKN